MTSKFAANPYYVECEEQLKELHRLIAAGKGDSDDADALREAMERSERELGCEEIDRLGGLSADLYMLEDDEIYEPLQPGEDASERAPERLWPRLQEAWEQQGDAETTLALLRKGTADLPEDQRAYIRARAYEKLGHRETALLFHQYADAKAAQHASGPADSETPPSRSALVAD
jgi:DNA-directed RNA polymerase specialized sigma24 family protein